MGPLDLRDDGIKKINMLIIFFLPSLYSSFRHLRRVTVSLVNKMTVLSMNDCEVPFRKVCFRSLTCDIIFSGVLCAFFPLLKHFIMRVFRCAFSMQIIIFLLLTR